MRKGAWILLTAIGMYALTFAGLMLAANSTVALIKSNAADHAACIVRAGAEHFDSIRCP